MCLIAQSCPTLCDPVDCSPPGYPVHGILQARTLEWVAIPFSVGYSQLRDQTQVSCIAGRCFTIWATREVHICQWQCHCLSSSHLLFIPLSPQVHFLHLGLCSCPENMFTSAIFLDSHMRINIWYLFFSFWLTSLCITGSRFIHYNRLRFISFYGWVIFHRIYASHVLYPTDFMLEKADGYWQEKRWATERERVWDKGF